MKTRTHRATNILEAGLPQSFPALTTDPVDSSPSRETILKDANGIEPGCVEIIPRNLVIVQLRTWLYSLQTDTKYFSVSFTFVTGLRWTVKVWKSWGPCPTVSGCCTMTRTIPDWVPYAISIQFPQIPGKYNLIDTIPKTNLQTLNVYKWFYLFLESGRPKLQ